MRIGYLNPWKNAAENQAAHSIASAARTLGVELITCDSPEQLDRSRADFVISVASSVPKVVDVPSYLTVHEPTKRFLQNAFYFNNLLSYDGFLTISDSLNRFLKDVCFGVGRPDSVGFFYNTPQSSSERTDLEDIVARDALRIVYVGTNWERRTPRLLRTLDDRGLLRIHGPEASWRRDAYASYAGPLPFDGLAPQKAYAQAGLGLVLLSADHLREDVISNRIFEIASVGAVAVCPDTPWVRKWFGDSVLYFEADAGADAIATEIEQHYAFVRDHPHRAAEIADNGRAIFERRFAGERMLENAISYHEENRRRRKRRLATLGSAPEISVIVRCGGRPLETVRATVESIRRQTYGRFVVILSKYKDIDLSPITRDSGGRVEKYLEVLTPDAGPARTLYEGLGRVSTEFFAILDDDDFWFDDHVETLFAAGARADPAFDVVFSGTLCIAAEETQIETSLSWARNIQSFGLSDDLTTVIDVTKEFASNCFVARSELIPGDVAELAELHTAEDSFIVGLVTRRKRPVFSYKATAVFRRGFPGESGFRDRETREADVRSVAVRLGMLLSPRWLNRSGVLSDPAAVGGPDDLEDPRRMRWRTRRAAGEGRLVLRPGDPIDVGALQTFDGFGEGWATPDAAAIWTQGPRAEVALALEEPIARPATLTLTFDKIGVRGGGVYVAVALNGASLAARDLARTSGEVTWRVRVPAGLLASGDADLALTIGDRVVWSDERRLGVHLRSLAISEGTKRAEVVKGIRQAWGHAARNAKVFRRR